MRSVAIHSEALAELKTAARNYEREQVGLGGDFIVEYRAAIQRIVEHPMSPRPIYGLNRKHNLERFPYGIVFVVTEQRIFVKAVTLSIAGSFIGDGGKITHEHGSFYLDWPSGGAYNPRVGRRALCRLPSRACRKC